MYVLSAGYFRSLQLSSRYKQQAAIYLIKKDGKVCILLLLSEPKIQV